MFRTSNPALQTAVFRNARAQAGEEVMTIQGTINKTVVMLVLVVFTAFLIWTNMQLMPLLWPAAIAGLIVGIVTVFKKEWAHITAPVYAGCEGIVLGGISAMFEQSYPGIVIQAVILTFGTAFVMLLSYRSGLIKPTEKFKLGVVAATGGIAIVYFISFIFSLFGKMPGFIYGSTPIGIGFSILVVIIAALNLVLDFDFIEQASRQGLARYMEWYGAFSLVVTLVWLYMEILRLLAKTRRR